ncbi:N-acetyl-D-glucosamine kinase [Granulosicoccus antarcticus IMCC3135]|uniref:N-acetylglucosamine kinase n=2 Tax=Granulosicoccus TaxID=437504 RepID=A0A2Z2NSF5_9GAMM|nr:N-acetyl-D-glucosamine kinase [Granulosicoccus antarcticus IMCC3135]
MNLCLDIGGSKIVAASVTESGQITEHARMATPVDHFDDFCAAIKRICPPDSSTLGVSIAGVIDPQTGQINSANIPCISGHELARELELILGRGVVLINDADAFALAEAHLGRARQYSGVLAVILGTGVGGALVLDGRLHVGLGGLSGEWGHGPASAMRTGTALPVVSCSCGQQGCVDTLGGARGIERLHHHLHGRHATSLDIVKAWQSGCQDSEQVIDLWLDVVGGALAAAVNLIGPAIVPVGGGLARSEALIEALDREVCNRSLINIQSSLLYSAASGPEQGLLGAALRVRQVLTAL